MKVMHLCAAGFLLSAVSGAAQTIDDIRDELRESLRGTHFAKGLVGLVLVSDEIEFGGSVLFLDDEEDTEIRSFSLPAQRSYAVAGEDAPKLYLEGAIGYAKASQESDDIYEGALPMVATSVDTDWITFGGIAGAGIEFEVHEEVTLTPIANVGIARLENDTDYEGPGSALTAAIADGIAFNWDSTALSYGTALRAEWDRDLTDRHEFSLVGRYDLRWTESIEEDDPVQDFSTRAQTITLRADIVGPTGWQLFERRVNWRATVGGKHFIEGDLFDAEDYYEVGGGLEMPNAVLGTTVSINAGVFVGEDLVGYSAGLGVAF